MASINFGRTAAGELKAYLTPDNSYVGTGYLLIDNKVMEEAVEKEVFNYQLQSTGRNHNRYFICDPEKGNHNITLIRVNQKNSSSAGYIVTSTVVFGADQKDYLPLKLYKSNICMVNIKGSIFDFGRHYAKVRFNGKNRMLGLIIGMIKGGTIKDFTEKIDIPSYLEVHHAYCDFDNRSECAIPMRKQYHDAVHKITGKGKHATAVPKIETLEQLEALLNLLESERYFASFKSMYGDATYAG